MEKHQDGKNRAKRFILIIKAVEQSTGKPQSIATLLLHRCVSANKIPCFMCPRGNMDGCLLLRTLRDGVLMLKKQKGKQENGQRDS